MCGPVGDGGTAISRAFAAVLASLNTQIKALESQIAAQLAAHPDQHVFTSRPARAPSAPPGC